MTQAHRVRESDRDPNARMALRPAAYAPHQQVGHMAAPTSIATQLFKLANGGPSTHGSASNRPILDRRSPVTA